MDEDDLEALLAAAGEADPARRAAFLADLPGVRAAGFAENDSFTIAGVVNISAPVRDITGRVVAAMTVPYVRRLSGTTVVPLDEARESLLEMADRISRQLGAGATMR